LEQKRILSRKRQKSKTQSKTALRERTTDLEWKKDERSVDDWEVRTQIVDQGGVKAVFEKEELPTGKPQTLTRQPTPLWGEVTETTTRRRLRTAMHKDATRTAALMLLSCLMGAKGQKVTTTMKKKETTTKKRNW
jgi:hypothetical protein